MKVTTAGAGDGCWRGVIFTAEGESFESSILVYKTKAIKQYKLQLCKLSQHNPFGVNLDLPFLQVSFEFLALVSLTPSLLPAVSLHAVRTLYEGLLKPSADLAKPIKVITILYFLFSHSMYIYRAKTIVKTIKLHLKAYQVQNAWHQVTPTTHLLLLFKFKKLSLHLFFPVQSNWLECLRWCGQKLRCYGRQSLKNLAETWSIMAVSLPAIYSGNNQTCMTAGIDCRHK